MRTYKIQVNGQDYTIEIDDPNASPATVLVNGRAFEVTVSEPQAAVQLVRRSDASAELEEPYVPTVTSTYVETAIERTEISTTAPETPQVAGDVREVTAPMPGKVLDITVQVGTPVKHGDTLCNLEAMKMKSPIRATADGTIVQILISEGQNVNFGDVLFTLQ